MVSIMMVMMMNMTITVIVMPGDAPNGRDRRHHQQLKEAQDNKWK